HPITRQRPTKPSAHVAMMARAGMKPPGKNQLSFPVYITNRAKVPQDTLGRPKAPHNPNRSARAERKDRPRASRKNSDVSPLSRSILSLEGWCMLTSPPADVGAALRTQDHVRGAGPRDPEPLDHRIASRCAH